MSGSNITIYESNANFSRCIERTVSLSDYSGYSAYRVKAWDDASSNPPSKPTGLTAKATGKWSVSLTWSMVSGAEEYYTFASVRLGDNTEAIETKAFADCKNLKYIYIPAKTSIIAADAFDRGNDLTIIGEEGSYAEYFANKNGFTFVSE